MKRRDYKDRERTEVEKELTRLQLNVTKKSDTERPFDNEYWRNTEPGIYVDLYTGEPLFTSLDKFDSDCGWPSFTKPVKREVVEEKADWKFGMHRIEVRSKESDSHLGHVFNDGPEDKGGLRYCINSAAVHFIPKDRLAEEGYEEYLELFKDEK